MAEKTKAQLQEENDMLANSLREMQEQMAALMKQVNTLSSTTPAISSNVAKNADITARKVDVISFCPNPATLSTEKYGQGVVYTFNNYGSVRKIKFNDLERIVNTTKNVATDCGIEKSFFERGLFYICDNEVVEELGLDTYYEDILDKKKIDKMVALDSIESVDIFKGANTSIRESVVRLIVDKYNENYTYDRNLLSAMSNVYGKDIVELAEKLKKASKRTEKSEE